MLKGLITSVIVIALAAVASFGQGSEIDSLQTALQNMPEDSNRVNTLIEISSKYGRSNPEKVREFAQKAEELAHTLNYKKGQAYAYKAIGMGFYFENNWVDALVNWKLALEIFESISDPNGISNMLNNLGAVHFSQGDYENALDYYLKSLKEAEKIKDTLRIATALVNIGSIYLNKESNRYLALSYYKKSMPMSLAIDDMDAIGTTAVNIGEIYLQDNDLDSALYYFNMALDAYQQSDIGNVAYALKDIGRVYSKQGNYDQAIQVQEKAYELAKNQGARLEMAQSLLGLATTYEEKGDVPSAIIKFKEAKTISDEISAKYELIEAYSGLAENYAKISDYKSAYIYRTLFSEMKDTLYNAEVDKKLEAKSLSYEIEKKQGQIALLEKDQALKNLELKRQKAIRNATGLTGILLLLLIGGLFNRYRYVRKTSKIIANEKERSEKLLLNILPFETAEELKIKGSATPKHYDMVSVLFTDFKGFTKIAEKLTPQELVEELNQCFVAFDRIIDKYKLEKIKTIGDAYMCAGGIPAANKTNPIDIVKAGLEIRQFMDDLKKEREAIGKDYWELRIGIHTGPVIAGVVGKNKFAYDIWGDAVNTASRMESSGIPGQVNISGTTYDYIHEHFHCTHRGKVQAKNKGEIDMYIVDKPNHDGN